MKWESQERCMSIQTHPPQSIIKTAKPLPVDYPPNIPDVNSPTSMRNSREMRPTLRRKMALRDGWRSL